MKRIIRICNSTLFLIKKCVLFILAVFIIVILNGYTVWATDDFSMTVDDYLNYNEKPVIDLDLSDFLENAEDISKKNTKPILKKDEKQNEDEKSDEDKNAETQTAGKEASGNEESDDNEAFAKELYIPKDNEKWLVLLVNKQNYIGADFVPELVNLNGSMQCDKRVAPYVAKMLNAASKDGVSLMICSAYRSYDRQTELFTRKLRGLMGSGYSYMEAYRKGSYSVTIPGTSEHQIGMAFDIVTPSYVSLDEGFSKTAAGKWLRENAAEYGFILRYPKAKEHITGITYEPWHFRYVGVDVAKCMVENDLTLEEYLDEIGFN